MGLVDDERVVAAQHRIRLDLRQQDAVRHELDEGRGADLVRETHLVADHLAPLAAHGLAELVGDAVRDGARREPARLGVPDHAGHAAAQLHADLRQLRRLTRARLARHNDHLVVADGARDLVAPGAHRQVREFDHRDSCGALGELLRRERLEGARVRARAAPAAALGLAILVASSPASARLALPSALATVISARLALASAFLAAVISALALAAPRAVAPVRGTTRVGVGAARVGLGRRGTRVRHDRASLVAGQMGTPSGARGARAGQGRGARGAPGSAYPPKSHVIPFGQFLSVA